MNIRKATIKDFENLKKIKTEFYLWECGKDQRLNPDWMNRGLGSRLGRNLRQNNTLFLIVEQDSEIIAYLGAEILKNPAWVNFKRRGHVFNLYVKPKYRNKNIGTLLIRKSLEWFKSKDVRDLMIMVYKNNNVAKKIYKKLGFKEYINELTNQR